MVKKIALLLIALCTSGLSFNSKSIQPQETGFAVIELFTSEGCSSCPPADALIAKIEKESKNKSVYILAYHVDYWDRLGWKDTFSDAKYSARQNQYANWLNLNSVYTPQIVVNGCREFIGSEEKTLRGSIATALSEPNHINLEVSIKKQDEGLISLNYRTNQPTQNYNLIAALIEPNATNKIGRGENKGKTLSHVQIVRKFETFNLNGNANGIVNLAVEKRKSINEVEIVAFLQNNKTGKITAATKLNTQTVHI